MTVMDGLFRNGVLLRREAIELGFDDESLAKAVRHGHFVRIRQGAYVEAGVWGGADAVERHRLLTEAVRRIYGPGVMVSRSSAVVGHAGPSFGLDLTAVDITTPSGTGRTQGSVRHHLGEPRDDDIRCPDGSVLTSVARTVVEAVVQSGRIDVGVVLASYFLNKGVVSDLQLDHARALMGRCAGSLILRTALALADRRLETVLESRCWYVLKRGGLPPVTPQYSIRDESGLELWRLDFLIEELGVWVETDGKAKYYRHRRPGESMDDFLRRERERENAIREITGLDVVRVTWADLADPDKLIQRILTVAARRQSRLRAHRTVELPAALPL